MRETRICPFCGKETDKFIMFRGDIVGCRYCMGHNGWLDWLKQEAD